MEDWAKKLNSWWTPKQTLNHVNASKGNEAATILFDRLKGGRLEAIASTWSKSGGDDTTEHHEEPMVVAAWLWKHLQTSSFWNTDDAKFRYIEDLSGYEIDIYAYDIRFNPDKIREQFPAPVAVSGPPDAAPIFTPAAPEPEQKGKPVAAAQLAKWAALYVESYPENEDTGDKAWESAKGMFVGKSVSREAARKAVAAIRPRTRGRKPTGE